MSDSKTVNRSPGDFSMHLHCTHCGKLFNACWLWLDSRWLQGDTPTSWCDDCHNAALELDSEREAGQWQSKPPSEMTVTVHRTKDRRWWFDQDKFVNADSTVTYLIRVPAGSTFVGLIDCSRPQVSLHALELPFKPDLKFPVNAALLVEFAENKTWPDVRIVTTIV